MWLFIVFSSFYFSPSMGWKCSVFAVAWCVYHRCNATVLVAGSSVSLRRESPWRRPSISPTSVRNTCSLFSPTWVRTQRLCARLVIVIIIIIFIHTRSIINVNMLYNIQLLINIKRNNKNQKNPHLAASLITVWSATLIISKYVQSTFNNLIKL